MKVDVTLPHGYARSFFGKNKDGKFEFIRSVPRFNFDIFDDNGTRIQDPYPLSANMGVDMYNMLSKIIPSLAARRNEDVTYNGIVEQKPRSSKAKYAYYGYGNSPSSPSGVRMGEGVELLGFGDTEFPRDNQYGTDYSGRSNFLYSKKLSDPSPIGSMSRSKVLTNILNNSWDFNPLLAPTYTFTDIDYDPDNDPMGKGARPTDQWIPRKDPNTGELMRRPDGRLMFMPVPLVQNLPIYNFRHPAYDKDPQAAWDMVHDTDSMFNWQKWGIAPTFADYTGNLARNTKGEPKALDYLLYNTRLADKKGYFEDFPELKENAHARLLDIKGQRSIERLAQAHREAVKEFEEDENNRQGIRYARRHMEQGGKRMSGSDMRDRYRSMLHHLAQDQPEMFTERGLDPSEKNAIVKFAQERGFDRYNVFPNDEAKIIVMLDDYVRGKKNNG